MYRTVKAIKDNYRAELESYNIPCEAGQHTEDLILNADEVMKESGHSRKE